MIRNSIRQYLLSKLAVTNIIGTRLYPVVLPQLESVPAIVYRRISGGHNHNIDKATGSAIPVFELDCWADTYAQAETLAEAVRGVMQGFDGTMGDTVVTACILDDETDDYEPPDEGSDRGVFSITLRYRIRYTESVPTF
jgi:hypothetical protein